MEEVNSLLNHHGAVVTEAVASDGNGALETLTEIVRLVMRGLRDQFAAGMGGVTETHPEPRSIEEKPSEAESADVPEGDPGSAPDPVPTQIHQAPPPASEPMAEGEDADDEVQDEPIPELLKAEFEEAREPIPDHEPNENGVEVDGDASPIKLIVPVDGIGTLELAIRISARVLEEGERKALKIDVTRAALVEHALASEPEVTDAAVVHADETPATLPETGIESEPLAEPETDAEVLEVKTDLPPLGGQAEEPLGSPLDGQESEDLYIPELPQTEKILLEEDLDAVEPEPSSPEPVSGYDPTLQPLDFDFPETEPEEEAPKKGLFGRFKKKQ